VARITLATAAHYAIGLSVSQIRIENPAPGIVPLYRNLGYIIAFREGVVRYLALNLSQE
jgi:hypothetical protein